TWDAAKDVAQGKQCMAYGAPTILRQPGRLRITWVDENSLRLDMDAGKQTRLVVFGLPRAPVGEATPQGDSSALWQTPQVKRSNAWEISSADANTNGSSASEMRKPGSTLKVVTTHLKPGYLRNNGVPFSSNAVLTEYLDLHSDAGQEYLVITSI